MKNDVDAFVSWLKQLELQLPQDVASNVTISPESDNRSAFIDLKSSSGKIGRLIFHEFGGADADAFDEKGDQIDLSQAVSHAGGWACVAASNFDEAFEPFTRIFFHSGSAN